MKLNEDFDDEYDDPLSFNSGRKNTIGTAAVVAVLFILAAVVIVVLANRSQNDGSAARGGAKGTPAAASDWNPDPDATSVISGRTGVASDLDFWDAYPTPGAPTIAPSSNAAATPTPWGNKEETDEEEEEEKLSVSEDGLHTLVKNPDGTEEWVELNPYLSRNTYQASGFVYQKPFKYYYENNTKKSFVGVDVSKEEGYVDYNLLKQQGVNFVMLRLGQRGYSTGELSVDETFMDNYTRAREAGLDIGVYFVTAAINTEEAKEEADFCIQILAENEVYLNYPLALSTMQLGSGKARTDDLEKMTRTNNAITFMKAVENTGLFSMLYGDKATLLKKYSLGSMIGYDIWYAGTEDIPDYPYQYAMWQYDKGGELQGIGSGAHLNLCFIDYAIR